MKKSQLVSELGVDSDRENEKSQLVSESGEDSDREDEKEPVGVRIRRGFGQRK